MEENLVFQGFIQPDEMISKFGLKENMRVADFGIGSGYFTILMAKAVGEKGSVAAIDILEAPLEVTRNKAELEGLGNIRFVRGDLEVEGGSKLENASQDFVLLANVLFQSKKRESILKEAARVAKTGGRIVVIDWKKGTEGLGGPPDEFRVDQEEVKSIAQSLGLKFDSAFEAGRYHYGLIFPK